MLTLLHSKVFSCWSQPPTTAGAQRAAGGDSGHQAAQSSSPASGVSGDTEASADAQYATRDNNGQQAAQRSTPVSDVAEETEADTVAQTEAEAKDNADVREDVKQCSCDDA